MQVTDTVLMISPDHFDYNIETSTTNSFQVKLANNNISDQALLCFNNFVNTLKKNGINVLTLKSKSDANTPDAVFPNNWFSTQRSDNQLTLILYPMLDPNRRAERRKNELLELLSNHHIYIDKIIDLTDNEIENKALEGTGSIVFDHENKIMYVSLSPRADIEVLHKLTNETHYKPITFRSYDKNDNLIYHTNVMMSIGKKFVVVCKECIHDANEQQNVMASLSQSGKQIILISTNQIHQMAGNILELQSQEGNPVIVMSTQALQAYSPEQKEQLKKFATIVNSDINIIETVGGGSARCMLAEIFK